MLFTCKTNLSKNKYENFANGLSQLSGCEKGINRSDWAWLKCSIYLEEIT